jgi:hypothetical protein
LCQCRRGIRRASNRVQVSTVFSGEYSGLEEIDDRIREVNDEIAEKVVEQRFLRIETTS